MIYKYTPLTKVMSETKYSRTKPRPRCEQLALIQKYTKTHNIGEIVEHLTDNSDIPVEEMGENLRNGVLLALLTETAREKNPDSLCELIDFLLEQRRNAKKKPEIDESFIETKRTQIVKEVEESILTFLDDEWPTY